MLIAIDFDGTCVKHEYPYVGEDIGAAPWLRKWEEAGARLVLYTMRDGNGLDDALGWFSDHDIPLHAANYNKNGWSASPKIYAELYVDDASFGVPLVQGKADERPWVDWAVIIGPESAAVLPAGGSTSATPGADEGERLRRARQAL